MESRKFNYFYSYGQRPLSLATNKRHLQFLKLVLRAQVTLMLPPCLLLRHFIAPTEAEILSSWSFSTMIKLSSFMLVTPPTDEHRVD